MDLATLGNRLYTGEKSFDIVSKQRRWYAVSVLIILVCFGGLWVRGLNLGIEFEGGSAFQVTAPAVDVQRGQEAVGGVVAGQVQAQQVGDDTLRLETEQLSPEETTEVQAALAEEFGVQPGDVSAQFVGPSWGEDVTQSAIRALLVFLALVVIYLSMTFEWKMAVAAIVALLHDILITVGIYAIVGFEVTPASVVGLLTILGYSLYDTVVVFDKVRENTAGITAGSRATYSEAANLALNQTIVRSVNTTVIALLPIGAILFVGAGLLGAGTLKDLALSLFVGVAAGAYSSIFIATPLLADLKEREPAVQALRERVHARRSGVAATAPRRRAAAGAGAGTGTALLEAPGDGAGGPLDDGAAAHGDAHGDADGAAGGDADGAAGTGRGATALGAEGPHRGGQVRGPRNQPRRTSAEARKRPGGRKR
ncbi:protein translocase subunit SecF [Vallicoccus soli]|uniref:protein translocase subunit SecF n=1 Tax=Vallicoccus soli TaxID=2339232 RepID=UPI001C4982E4|nr:protein translocase subunit SecF [Vallicoccus soli]